jgi:hypothetical protein
MVIPMLSGSYYALAVCILQCTLNTYSEELQHPEYISHLHSVMYRYVMYKNSYSLTSSLRKGRRFNFARTTA